MKTVWGTELKPRTSVETGWSLSSGASVKSLPSAVANYISKNTVNSHIQLDSDSAKAARKVSINHIVKRVAVRIAACIFLLLQTVRTTNDYTTKCQNIFSGNYNGGVTINGVVTKLHLECGWMELYTEAFVNSSTLSLPIGRTVNVDSSMNVGSFPVLIYDVSVQEI